MVESLLGVEKTERGGTSPLAELRCAEKEENEEGLPPSRLVDKKRMTQRGGIYPPRCREIGIRKEAEPPGVERGGKGELFVKDCGRKPTTGYISTQ